MLHNIHLDILAVVAVRYMYVYTLAIEWAELEVAQDPASFY